MPYHGNIKESDKLKGKYHEKVNYYAIAFYHNANIYTYIQDYRQFILGGNFWMWMCSIYANKYA